MRVGIDYTPALTQPAGVGRYTRSLVEAMTRADSSLGYRLLYARGSPRDHLVPLLRDRPHLVAIEAPISERWLNVLWYRLRLPLPADVLAGGAEVFHFPDFLAAPVRRSAVVITVHDLSFLLHPQYAEPSLARYLTRAIKPALRRAAAIIAVSESTAADILHTWPGLEGRLHVVHNGVDPYFRPPEPHPVASETIPAGVPLPFVLAVGTVEPRKNHEGLLTAMQRLWERGWPHALVLAGKRGWQSDEFYQRLSTLGPREKVVTLGPVDDDQLRSLYWHADVLAYPSFYEGFGLPVLEAMASGCPVVTSNGSALGEVAGDAAVLIDPTRPDELAEAMITVLDHPAERCRLRERGIARARAFSWDDAAQRTLSIYRAVA